VRPKTVAAQSPEEQKHERNERQQGEQDDGKNHVARSGRRDVRGGGWARECERRRSSSLKESAPEPELCPPRPAWEPLVEANRHQFGIAGRECRPDLDRERSGAEPAWPLGERELAGDVECPPAAVVDLRHDDWLTGAERFALSAPIAKFAGSAPPGPIERYTRTPTRVTRVTPPDAGACAETSAQTTA
jgi:hypothetical protein